MSRIGKGIFIGSDSDGIYFTPTVLNGYATVSSGKWEGKVDFFNSDSLSDFEEVEDPTVKDLNKIDDKEIEEETIPEYTMEQLVAKLGNFKIKK
jgi:hypothetical protein